MKGLRRWALAVALTAGLAVPALAAAPASAEEVVQHEYLGEQFNGEDSSGGEFGNRLKEVNVNDATGNVYVTTSGCAACGISQFDPSGKAKAYTYPLLGGSSTLTFPFSNFGGETIGYTTIDNSGGPTQGRIYVVSGEKVYAFNPDGSPVNGYPITVGNARGLAVNPKTGNLWVDYSGFQLGVNEYEPSGKATGVEIVFGESGFIQNNMAINNQGDMYVVQWMEGAKHVRVYNEAGEFQYVLDPSSDGNDASVAVSPTTNNVYVAATQEGVRKVWEYNEAGTQIASFGSPTPGLAGLQAVGVNGTNETVYTGSLEPSKRVDIFPTGGTLDIPKVTKGGVTNIAGPTATIHGNVNPEGIATTSCKFEYGPNANYGHTETCAQGNVLTGSSEQDVSLDISGLSKGQTYHYRVIVANANGTATSADGSFVASSIPIVTDEYVSEVHSDQALVHATVNPEGVPATYHIEYGPEACETAPCESSPELEVGTGTIPIEVAFRVTGLTDGTKYFYRVVATNQSGPGYGPEEFFITFPTTESLEDRCGNAHVRQQTGSALLLDCRAYELVSAANTGGYNVESDLTAGQTPYNGYPDAESVLYAVHSGAIPGAGPATNRGRDPYVATRGSEGWTTKYVGVSSENEFSEEAFGSELLEADPTLGTFAFGGPGICSPCFADESTNIPLRLPNGELVEGIGAAANPAGHVGRYLSADGEHLVFGSTTKLATGGNENGDVSIYERALPNGPTQLVSTDETGATLTGEGIAELSVSADGSRVVVGRKLSEDGAGDEYRHLYMHISGSADSVDLMPGATDGALFDGMTEDGSKVFFTTDDSLVGEDTDGEADIYEAEVDPAGVRTLTLISSGGGAATCEPPEEWNTEAGEENCDAMALAGGAGLASENGTFYFLSPEQLDGSNGILDQPNLYVVQPGGSPEFVATIDSSIGRPEPPPPARPLITTEFGGSGKAPYGMSVAANGDLYYLSNNKGAIIRLKPNGGEDPFTAPAAGGTNELPAEFEGYYGGIAVDNSSGPMSGDFYLARGYGGPVNIYAPSGEQVGELTGFSEACGVAVDPNNGTVYVMDYSGDIHRFEPLSGAGPITNANYKETGIHVPEFAPVNGAVDGAGNIYAGNGETVKKFSPGEFAASPFPIVPGSTFAKNAQSVTVDPVSNEVFTAEEENDRIANYTSGGVLIAHYGQGKFERPRRIAFNPVNRHLYVAALTGGFKIAELGYEPIEFHLLTNTAVRNAKFQPEVHTYGDFQVTPSGNYAAFSSTQPLTGFGSNEHGEVFRYEPSAPETICISCNPTNARATGDATLPTDGLGLLEDGRVFFDSTEAIAARDLDGNEDAYEYENGELQLISTGVSAFSSSVLGADASGKNVYFFTRDSLVPQDQNGAVVKVYDAREEGGFAYSPPPVPCKASDECHGASSPIPPEPAIGSIRGTKGQYLETGGSKKNCAKGKVRRGGKCVKKKKAHHKKKHKNKHGKKRSR